MPWIVRRDPRCPDAKPFGVVNEVTDVLHGCHPDKDHARKQQKALYANVPEPIRSEPEDDTSELRRYE